ncbi:MAG: glycosyltransferase family 2 protein [Myxococcales bacterium]|nr:glycosyltransferase family 2 protein [Myxococcales bacterium]
MNPCLLIPIFEHKDEIGGVARELERFELACLVIDDGSGPETRAVLRALERAYPWLSVHRRERNGGRGAALKTGYRLAAQRGFSHAIQLDADGQHDAADVPRFLDAIASDPDALVLGVPRFDATAPRSRLVGRQLSRAMVWLATLSFDVVDPLCGFRGIPLASAVALLDAVRTGDHMEFDPELVIHLQRRGVAIRSVPTRVIYRSEGLSHFDMLRDNVRLSGVYARALLGAPGLLAAHLTRRIGGAAWHTR